MNSRIVYYNAPAYVHIYRAGAAPVDPNVRRRTPGYRNKKCTARPITERICLTTTTERIFGTLRKDRPSNRPIGRHTPRAKCRRMKKPTRHFEVYAYRREKMERSVEREMATFRDVGRRGLPPEQIPNLCYYYWAMYDVIR